MSIWCKLLLGLLLPCVTALLAPAHRATGQSPKSERNRASDDESTEPPLTYDRDEPPPNLIVIMVDDMGYAGLSCFGNPYFETPELDSMATAGMRLTDFHSNGTVCSPTRAALLTGRYQQRAGIEAVIHPASQHPEHKKGLMPRETTFAEQLKSLGYATGLVGKWHQGYPMNSPDFHPQVHGFDEFIGYHSGNIDFLSHVGDHNQHDWWYGKHEVREQGYTTDLINRYSLDFVRRYARLQQPFCLYVAHEAIHNPVQVPGDPVRRTESQWQRWRWREASQQERIDKYRGMTLAVDRGVGELLRTLREFGIDRNTCVLFFSDNGPSSDFPSGSDELRGGKGSVYEGGHKVPAIAWWPGHIKAGSVCDHPMMTMDIMPTLLSLASANPAANPGGVAGKNKAADKDSLNHSGVDSGKAQVQAYDGIDLTPALLRGQGLPTRPLYWASLSNSGQRSEAVRQGRWKLVVQHPDATAGSFENPQLKLYDLQLDPAEETDLSSQQPQRCKDLYKQLQAWYDDCQATATKQPGGWLKDNTQSPNAETKTEQSAGAITAPEPAFDSTADAPEEQESDTGQPSTAWEPLIDSIEKSTIRHNRDGKGVTWFHPRCCVVPSNSTSGSHPRPKILMNLQPIGGSDYFGPVHWSTSMDAARSWSAPQEIPSLGRDSVDGHPGLLAGVCDVTPQYHPQTDRVLALGHVVFYRGPHFARGDQLARYPVYAVQQPDGTWSPRRRLEWQDPRGSFIYSNNCGQRVVAPNGDIIMAFTFGPTSQNRMVAGVRCSFDGERLSVKQVGPALKNEVGRGLLEPSVAHFKDRYWMTIRAEDGHGYVAVSQDGLNYDMQAWKWDDGSSIAMSTTQQHWLVHSDGLFLVYTRKHAINEKVTRWRSPLWLARVDPNRRCLIRSTERLVLPMVGDGVEYPDAVALMGNFDVTNISPDESIVTVGEWLPRQAATGNLLLARIKWRVPNALLP